MATIARRANYSLEEQIFSQPYEFDFHQAVRLLEKIRPQAIPLGEGSNPLKEALSIKARVTLSPSGADLQSLMCPSPDHPLVLTVNFLGLAGIQGPLPTPFTELAIERLRHKDTNLSDFLDIFNHRLAGFWHRMRKKIVLGLAQVPPEATAAGKSFLDLAGIEEAALRNRLGVSDKALLHHAPLFWARPRSLIGLQRLLQSYFGLPLRVSQFQGGWQTALQRDWTKIGITGQHQILGKSAVLGQRSWDQAARLAVHVPPLTYEQYLGFQRGSHEFQALKDLTHFYVGEGQPANLMVSIQREHILPTRLNRQVGLGRTAWMTRGHGKGFAQDPEIKMRLIG